MVDVRIYAEGGGDGQVLDSLFRAGWAAFFKAAGFAGRMPRVIRGKGRQQTYDLFRKAVKNSTPDALPLLLVDSEDPVNPNDSVWEHLMKRDGWHRPNGAGADDAFVMVQVMETWFLADPDALQRYFGSRFNQKAFLAWPDLESVPKVTVFQALEKATANCQTAYAKGKVSFELLAEVSPAAVEQRCRHARELLVRLRNV